MIIPTGTAAGEPATTATEASKLIDLQYPNAAIVPFSLKHAFADRPPPPRLAPIAGYCDLAYRLVARSCGGVGLARTDLLCPEGVLRENKRSMELAQTCDADAPARAADARGRSWP